MLKHPDYDSKEEAAALLGVSPRTLDRWWSDRVGPPRTKIVGRVMYRRAAIDEFLLKSEQTPVRNRAA